MTHRVAVIIPCHNEETTIAKVVADFRRELPQASIVVCDNNSDDLTSERARSAGALVIHEPRQGKGWAVNRLFDAVDADYYVMVDGDGTYEAADVHALLAPVVAGRAHMTVGQRVEPAGTDAFRRFHRFGNRLIRSSINLLFRVDLRDILSGYRVFDGTLVRELPLLSEGFELETEITLQALDKGVIVQEIPSKYYSRIQGSLSKINTVSDGILLMRTIFMMFKDYRPLAFFGTLSFIMIFVGIAMGTIPVLEFMETRNVRHVPTAILAVGVVLSGITCFATGLILDSINRRQRENYKLIAKLTSGKAARARVRDPARG
ncbi:MAG: glycosyltransferase [Magnetococcales bacterium]|nr:glycosyltransferase [Magnetococcales bacterium]MBF0156451.1 glycosyltransferase [Magnetococcales bacterium]